ncbi:hypothetical protein M0R45_008732 [Rubus argutus]|uniref:Protein kinase domain-containing protein n=1 Tax=Rubus argutus TaxID=59490 RepID=A0AAW1Y2Z7_RUBAR
MSNHKNVLKLLGCLEFPIPALVHEYATIGVLNNENAFGDNESLTWKARLRIAKQLANALTYLHTAFPRPVILRDLRPSCIFLDSGYVPKLSYFALSITIPPMKSHAEDEPKGAFGALVTNQEGERESITSYVKFHVRHSQIQTIIDPKIFDEVGRDEQAQVYLQDFLALALLCTQASNESDRPDMIDVSKELVRIEKSFFFTC